MPAVPGATYPLPLPVAHSDYPLAQANAQDARTLATSRVRYGAPIELATLGELAAAEAARVATERLQEAVEKLEAALA